MVKWEVERVNVRTLVSFEPGDYQSWQVELLAHTHRTVGQEGPLTALASVKSGVKLKDYGIEVIPTRWMSTHPVTKDQYPMYNKTASLCDYFNLVPCRDEMLLLLDPDMVLVGHWQCDDRTPIAEKISYMETDKNKHRIIRRHCKRNSDKVQPIGYPLIIHEEELRVIADRWYVLLEEMRADRLTRREAPWITDMHSFNIAAAECGVEFKMERRCSFANDRLDQNHCLLHYTYPITSRLGFHWDKRTYKAWSPMPKLKPDVPTAGVALHQIIEEYRSLVLGRQ
jgi:hypothetical protein